MAESQRIFCTDEEAQTLVLSIIRDAQKYAVMVTPFIELWGHARDAISLAITKGIKVDAIVRAEAKVVEGESVRWLVQNGVEVRAVDKLHAKIYLNENRVVLSSMNLTKYSAENSLEVAWLVTDNLVEKHVRDYVTNRLRRLAKPLEYVSPGPAAGTAAEPRKRDFARSGCCIRCTRPIPLNPEKPLCNDCYEDWAQWENPDYPERFCHSCGRPARVNYGRPLCDACYCTS